MDYAINLEPRNLHAVTSISRALKKDVKVVFQSVVEYLSELRGTKHYQENKFGDVLVFVNVLSGRQFYIKPILQRTDSGYGVVDFIVSNNVKDDIIKRISI